MRKALLTINVQPSFTPPRSIIDGSRPLIGTLPSVAAIEHHDEFINAFQK